MFDYQEFGTGPAVLFIPGSFSTGAAWRALQGYLPGDYQLVSTSLLGCGNSVETRSVDDHGIEHELNLIAQVIARINAPVHLVAHSFGGAVAFAAALSGRFDIRSIATFEANPAELLLDCGRDDLFGELWQLSNALESDLAAGVPDAAARIIDYWDGVGTFALLPKRIQDYCNKTVQANNLDWKTSKTFTARGADYTGLNIPALVVRAERANKSIIEITGVLDEFLPDVRCEVVAGSGHSLIVSHPKQCAALLAQHLARAIGQGGG